MFKAIAIKMTTAWIPNGLRGFRRSLSLHLIGNCLQRRDGLNHAVVSFEGSRLFVAFSVDGSRQPESSDPETFFTSTESTSANSTQSPAFIVFSFFIWAADRGSVSRAEPLQSGGCRWGSWNRRWLGIAECGKQFCCGSDTAG